MSRRTNAIVTALSVLALGSTLISSCVKPSAVNLYNRGVAKQEQGDYKEAIADYTKAIEIDPSDARSCNNRGFKV